MTPQTLIREVHIEATPEIVFDVVSSPQHLEQWWPDEASFAPDAAGYLRFGDCSQGGKKVGISVVEATPFRLFAFRWTQEIGSVPTAKNSLLVRFELEPSGSGTVLTMVESGFDDRDLDDERVLAEYQDHESGWDHFLGRLPAYAASVVVTR
ncbi:MAG: SRPBCC domain-containing protein [Propionibacteriales bacterium]|nr:SRPBCC domain-containing protein [Propionibacteriales bacterium]